SPTNSLSPSFEPSHSPTRAPSMMPTTTPSSSPTTPITLYASKVRIQHNSVGYINIMEVQVFSGGTNVALQGTAELSSTLPVSPGQDWNFDAFTAIDGITSDTSVFAHSSEENGTQGVA
ncbi:hypothetical protein THAOC_08979, partial [Thalassiosira oceanica]